MTGSEIQSHLHTRIFGTKIFLFDVLDSTNLKAKAMAVQGEQAGTLIIAEEQTAGRGRLGRVWISEAGKNLTFSLIIRPGAPPEFLGLLPIAAGLAVAQAIEELTGLRPECKWPNDVLLAGRKFSGILCEVVTDAARTPWVVAGIGINVNQTVFPPELETTATSLRLASGREFDRARVLASVLDRLETLYAILTGKSPGAVRDSWRAYAPMLGKTVTITNQSTTITGKASGLAPDGGLLVHTARGEVKVLAGDVTIKAQPCF
jgi:BirA family biotin operon repressor/biotin-[acetyl-CoA-carboxylase] ligase